MQEKQKTVAASATIKGKGLHTGQDATLTINPAPEDHGFKFQRVDLEGKPIINALADSVIDTQRGTIIGKGDVRIVTIEHLLSALVGLGVDNALIEVDGEEVPIMDGSPQYFVQAIKKVGIKEQEKEREYFIVKEKITYTDPENNIELIIYPDDKFSVDVMVDYDSKIVGHQFASFTEDDNFEKELSKCRTFVFLRELENLFKNNLVKGGDLNNAIIIVNKEMSQQEQDDLSELFNKPKQEVIPAGVLCQPEMYFDNEMARHKLLDLIGDLTLAGKQIKGKVVATRPGHKSNIELAKILRKLIKDASKTPGYPTYDPNEKPIYDIADIKKILPHRHPFLLVDKIFYMDEKSVCGVKNITFDESFFAGHFPEEPVFPGVLQVESMAQIGGILALNTVPDPENYLTYFMKIDNFKFKQKVFPGDTLIVKLTLDENSGRRGVFTMHGQAFVGNKIVSEGDLMAQIVKPI